MVRLLLAKSCGVWCCRAGTRVHRSRLTARAQLLSGGIWRSRRSVPRSRLAAGATFRRRDSSTCSASLSPMRLRSHATRPGAGRVRPAWEVGVLGLGDAGTGWHETGFGVSPEGDQELAGESCDHDPSQPPLRASGACFEPLAQGTVGLEAQPAPRHFRRYVGQPNGSVEPRCGGTSRGAVGRNFRSSCSRSAACRGSPGRDNRPAFAAGHVSRRLATAGATTAWAAPGSREMSGQVVRYNAAIPEELPDRVIMALPRGPDADGGRTSLPLEVKLVRCQDDGIGDIGLLQPH